MRVGSGIAAAAVCGAMVALAIFAPYDLSIFFGFVLILVGFLLLALSRG